MVKIKLAIRSVGLISGVPTLRGNKEKIGAGRTIQRQRNSEKPLNKVRITSIFIKYRVIG